MGILIYLTTDNFDQGALFLNDHDPGDHDWSKVNQFSINQYSCRWGLIERK